MESQRRPMGRKIGIAFGGLAQEMPLYSAFVGFAFMASLGLPGLSGFWGEAMTFIGAFPRYRVLTILAATGVIITAAYHLWALQRMFLGPLNEKYAQLPEINGREIFTLAPLAAIVIFLGIYPTWMIEVFRVSLSGILSYVH